MRVGVWFCLAQILGFPNVAEARPKAADVGGGAVPALEATLVAAGWTMTPERSSSYNVGDIYSRSTNTPVAFKDKCFDAEPRENAYTSLEVVQAMKAGARVPLGVARFKAEGMEYKQLKFAEPYMTELADMDLVLKEQCQKFLTTRDDLADLFVIKAVLSAEVKEQLCRSIEGAAGAVGFGASVEAQQECVQASEGHVAVAYKTQDAGSLVTIAAPLIEASVVAAAPVSVAVAVPSQATANVDFGGGGASLGVAERLRQQRCDETAKVKGEQARAARLVAAEQDAQTKARTAWSHQSAELEMCASLKRAERDGCIDAVNTWLGVARSMVVSIPAGVEPIETECGTRQPAYEAVERTVVAADVKKAESLLTRLQSADGDHISSYRFQSAASHSWIDAPDAVDRSDPDMCLLYAVYWERQGVEKSTRVIKWSDYALENKSVWSGALHTRNVYNLHKLKSQAASRLWSRAEKKFVEDRNEKNESAATNYRSMAKQFSRAWLDYAKASGKDTSQPRAACVSASGNSEFCPP